MAVLKTILIVPLLLLLFTLQLALPIAQPELIVNPEGRVQVPMVDPPAAVAVMLMVSKLFIPEKVQSPEATPTVLVQLTVSMAPVDLPVTVPLPVPANPMDTFLLSLT